MNGRDDSLHLYAYTTIYIHRLNFFRSKKKILDTSHISIRWNHLNRNKRMLFSTGASTSIRTTYRYIRRYNTCTIHITHKPCQMNKKKVGVSRKRGKNSSSSSTNSNSSTEIVPMWSQKHYSVTIVFFFYCYIMLILPFQFTVRKSSTWLRNPNNSPIFNPYHQNVYSNIQRQCRYTIHDRYFFLVDEARANLKYKNNKYICA